MSQAFSSEQHDGFGTQAIHAGQFPDPSTGAIMPPIYQTSTYVQQSPGVHQGHEYARTSNPTRQALERSIAALEGAATGVAFGSGLAGCDAILKLLGQGDHIIASDDLYGGSRRLFTKVYERFGFSFTFVDMTDLARVKAALRDETRMIWLETPTNPLLKVIDIEAISSWAKGCNLAVVVDNTFASPYLQQPLALGADLVVHSTTKYLGGHSDTVGGIVVTSDHEFGETLRFLQNASGAVPGPMDCFLALRGVKTLHLRMERHSTNGLAVAEYLAGHPKVAHVIYPGLSSHPQHDLAVRQMPRGFGGMVSFELRDVTVEQAMDFTGKMRLFALAESLGGVESLVEHPASMTHASVPAPARRAAGLGDGLIRLSVGVEDRDDLIADLSDALNTLP